MTAARRLTAAFLIAFSVCAAACSDATKPAETTGYVAGDYPLTTCVVSGEELGAGGMKPYSLVHEGTEVRFCCEDCVTTFNKDPAKYVAMVKKAREAKK